MRALRPIGFTFVGIGIILGVLSFLDVVHLPVFVTLLPTIGVIIVLLAEIRLRQTRE